MIFIENKYRLTESKNSCRYWRDLKRKIKEEEGGIELYEKIVQLKFKSSASEIYKTDATDFADLIGNIAKISKK